MKSRRKDLRSVLSVFFACFCALGVAQTPAPPLELPPGVQVSAEDMFTTAFIPLDLPIYQDMHTLMEDMGKEHRKAMDRDPIVALRASEKVGLLARASIHPRVTYEDERFKALAEKLYRANEQLQTSLRESTDRRSLMKAFQAQNKSCKECHRVFRVDEE